VSNVLLEPRLLCLLTGYQRYLLAFLTDQQRFFSPGAQLAVLSVAFFLVSTTDQAK